MKISLVFYIKNFTYRFVKGNRAKKNKTENKNNNQTILNEQEKTIKKDCREFSLQSDFGGTKIYNIERKYKDDKIILTAEWN